VIVYQEEVDPNRLYCICRKPYVEGPDFSLLSIFLYESLGEWMIYCDACHEWFHGSSLLFV